MVTPRQAQLQHLAGDTTGVGSSNDVVSLTGTAGVVNAQSARIGNVTDPINQQDAATKEYVDGYFFHNPLYVAGDALIDGKLTVTGLIDPTGLVLTPQAAAPIANSIWVESDAISGLVYTNSSSTKVFKAGEDTEPYVGVGTGYGLTGACRIPNNTYVTGTSGDGDSWQLVGVNGNEIRVGDSTASYTAGANGAAIAISGGAGVIPGTVAITGGTGTAGSTVGGGITIASGATDTRSGNINIYSEDGTSSGSGWLKLFTGDATGGTTGLLECSTGDSTVNSGAIYALTGNSTVGGSSGEVILGSGSSVIGTTGNVTVRTGAISVGGNSGTLLLTTGSSAASVGAINIYGGNNTLGAGGDINIYSGSSTGAAPGGRVTLLSGDAKNTVGGNQGGDLSIITGDGYTGGGDIFISLGVGFASGTTETRKPMIQIKKSDGTDIPLPDSTDYYGYINGNSTVIFGSASSFSVFDLFYT